MSELISHMQTHVEELRELLQNFESLQDESSDEGNAGHIDEMRRALDDLDGAVGDLVP